MPATKNRQGKAGKLAEVRYEIWQVLEDLIDRGGDETVNAAMRAGNLLEPARALTLRLATDAEVAAVVHHLLLLRPMETLAALEAEGVLGEEQPDSQ